MPTAVALPCYNVTELVCGWSDSEFTIAYMPWYLAAILKPDSLPPSFVVELP